MTDTIFPLAQSANLITSKGSDVVGIASNSNLSSNKGAAVVGMSYADAKYKGRNLTRIPSIRLGENRTDKTVVNNSTHQLSFMDPNWTSLVHSDSHTSSNHPKLISKLELPAIPTPPSNKFYGSERSVIKLDCSQDAMVRYHVSDSKLASSPAPVHFWFDDPSALFQTFHIVPNPDMTDAERLNAMTRVIIVIAAIMFLLKFPIWWLFLGLGILVVIVLWYIIKSRDQMYTDYVHRQREYLRKPIRKIIQPIDNIPRKGTSLQYNGSSVPLNIISIP